MTKTKTKTPLPGETRALLADMDRLIAQPSLEERVLGLMESAAPPYFCLDPDCECGTDDVTGVESPVWPIMSGLHEDMHGQYVTVVCSFESEYGGLLPTPNNYAVAIEQAKLVGLKRLSEAARRVLSTMQNRIYRSYRRPMAYTEKLLGFLPPGKDDADQAVLTLDEETGCLQWKLYKPTYETLKAVFNAGDDDD